MASNFCDQTKDYRQGDGTTVLFNFTFEYNLQSEVNVSLYDQEIGKFIEQDRSTWEFENATTIRFLTPPPLIKDKDGEPIANVMIFRMTDISAMQATFYPGSAIRAQDLNDNFEQLQSSLQEANCTLSDFESIIEGGGDKGVAPTTRFNTTATAGQTIVDVNPAFSPGQEIVFINGAEQAKDIDYRVVSSTQVVFTQPLLAGDVIDIISYNNIQLVEVCTEFDTIPYSRQAFTSTAGQTIYTCSPKYTATKENVYLNGALLTRNVDYTANDGVTVTLTMPALVGDVVEVHCGNYYAAGVETPTTNTLKYTYPGGVEQTVQQRLEQYVSVKDFGAVGDNTTDDWSAIQAAIQHIEANKGGTVYFPNGSYVVSQQLVISKPDVCLIGSGNAFTDFGTRILSSNPLGPVLRIKGEHTILRDFSVGCSGPRRTSPAVTKDNYASYGGRDYQNYGIWVEADDNSTDVVQFCQFTNVGAKNQPNSGWVIGGGLYSSTLNECNATNNLGHGFVADNGTYTGRTNTSVCGVFEVNTFVSKENRGHSLLIGNDSVGLSALRVLLYNLDVYNNGTDAGLLSAPYSLYMVADNSVVDYGAVSGNDTLGAIYCAGRNINLINNRLTYQGSNNPPITVAASIGGRATSGVNVDGFTLTSGSHVDVVYVEPGAQNVSVTANALDGTFSGLSAGATNTNRVSERNWGGSITIPDLNTTDLITATRDNNVPVIINRTTSGGPVQFNRIDNVNCGIVVANPTTNVSTTTVSLFDLPTRSGNLLIVTGSFNDNGTYRRFSDLVFFMWGVTPNVVSAEEENAPAARTYNQLNGKTLRMSVATGTYSVVLHGIGASIR